jgi:hypothetical protein
MKMLLVSSNSRLAEKKQQFIICAKQVVDQNGCSNVASF